MNKNWICFIFKSGTITFVYSSEPLQNNERYKSYKFLCPDKYFSQEDIDWVIENENRQLLIYRSNPDYLKIRTEILSIIQRIK